MEWSFDYHEGMKELSSFAYAHSVKIIFIHHASLQFSYDLLLNFYPNNFENIMIIVAAAGRCMRGSTGYRDLIIPTSESL